MTQDTPVDLAAQSAASTATENDTAADDADLGDRMAAPDDDDEGEGEGGASASNDDEDELEEIEHSGKKYKIPKAIAAERLSHADYVSKTATHAEAVRKFETERAQRLEADSTFAKESARVLALDDAVSWYESQDWQAMHAANPEDAQRQWMAYQQAKLRRDGAKNELDGKKTARADEDAKAEAKRLHETDLELSRDVKGWGPEMLRDLVGLAGTHGISPADLREATPAAWKVLHRLSVLEKAAKTQTTARNTAKTAAVVPAKTVAARSAGPAASDDRAGVDAWMKRRNEQTAKRRA